MLLTTEEKDCAYTVGLDASLTSFGVFCEPLGSEPRYHWSVQSTTKDGSDTKRIMEMADAIIEDLSALTIRMAVFEDYGPINRTSGKIAQRAEMVGILKRHFLCTLRVPIVMVPPPSLKQFATGKGKASKEDMLAAATQSGVYVDTNDEADAFFAARIGAHLLNGNKTGVSFTLANPVP